MPIALANPAAFAPLMDTPVLIAGVDANGVRRVARAAASVSSPNPYAEAVGGAARAESWSVWTPAAPCDAYGRDWPRRGASVSVPDRPDIPRLFVQRSYRLGALVCLECTSSERGPA